VGYQTLDSLLDLSLLRSGFRKREQRPVHLDNVLAKVRSVLAGVAISKRIEVQVACPSSLVVTSDPRLLQSIAQNLLSNAVKFTPKGGVVHIHCAELGDGVALEVEDHGTGIGPDDLARLNAGESIGTSSGTAGEKGSGWGLRMTRELCALAGARLRFSSEVGKGTRALVTLAAMPKPASV
jgi:signal transduction histidine kinase